MSIIAVNNLTKYYGKTIGISNVSFNVEPGDIFSCIGPNGSGKTTLIKLLMNYIVPTKGDIHILGSELSKNAKLIKKSVGYVPDRIELYGNIKVQSFFNYVKGFYKKVDGFKINSLCERFEIPLNVKINTLTPGVMKRLIIVQALLHSPDIIILDEPAFDLDPLFQKRLMRTLQEENNRGATIFFTTNSLDEAQKFCNKIVILKEGQISELKILDKRDPASKFIKVFSKTFIRKDAENIGASNIEIIEGGLSFLFDLSINKLLLELSKYDIDDLYIENENLSEKLIKFYY